MWLMICLTVFLGLAVVYVLNFVVRPRKGNVLGTLTSNRWRVKFVDPPPPKSPAEKHLRDMQAVLLKEGYGKSLQEALENLAEDFRANPERVEEFVDVTGALILLVKFVGVTSFELAHLKRSEQDHRNLAVAVDCLRLIADNEKGRQALIDTNFAVSDLYGINHYAQPETRAVAYSILRDLVSTSAEALKLFVEAAEFYMYIPGNEQFLFFHMLNSFLLTDDDALKLSGLGLLEAMLKDEHGELAAMVRGHLNAHKIADRLRDMESTEKSVQELRERVLEALAEGDQKEPTFHTTPFDTMSCYSKQFEARVRWFSRTLNCVWTTVPATLPTTSTLRRYTDEERQNALQRLKNLKDKKGSGSCSEEEVQSMNREMSAITLGVETDFFDKMMECGMFEETRVFIREAEKVANWNHEEMLQAGRNVWTCFGLQLILFNEKITMTDAYLGYSLLYPYTDNFLDDDSITKKDKKIFQDLFTRRLAGENVEPRSQIEKEIFDMVGKVENVFDRKKFPDAFNSMIAINEAQTKSLAQHTEEVPPEETILEITMEKGGTSVLADGYLVHGTLSEEDAMFSFGLGVALQLVDDLQDTTKDLSVNQHTLYTLSFARKEPADAKVLKLLQLMNIMINPDHYSDSMDSEVKSLRKCMLKMTNTIAFKAVAKYCYLFTEAFVEDMASFSPIPLSSLQRVNNMARMLQMVRNNQI
ncbi:Carboxylesterase superfamily protein [Balamuthia mandrillaris]